MEHGVDRKDSSPTKVATMAAPPRPLLRPMAPLFAPTSGGQTTENNPESSPGTYTANIPKYAPRPMPILGVPHLSTSPLQMPPLQAPTMMPRPGLMMPGLGAALQRPPAPRTIMARNEKQQLVVTLEVKDDFEPCLELKYDSNKPVMHLSAEDSSVTISAVDTETGQQLYHEPLRLPLRFPNLHYAKLDYTDGARLEVKDVAMLKAPITRYSGKDPTIRIRTIGTSGRIGFIDRGTSPKNRNPAVKPPKVGEGIFEYTVTLDEEVIAEVAAEEEPTEDTDSKSATEMFVSATIQLQGVITASVTA